VNFASIFFVGSLSACMFLVVGLLSSMGFLIRFPFHFASNPAHSLIENAPAFKKIKLQH
jgi:hypothetical protein